jgi:hypothetical protein
MPGRFTGAVFATDAAEGTAVAMMAIAQMLAPARVCFQVVSDTASPSTCGQEVRWREAGVYFLILLESA